MHGTEALAEGDRVMTVCNSCRYCEGLCAVFPAMEMRRAFPDGDLSYLANLCHNCGACYYDCQFAPPHEFNVNVPLTLARIRGESYARYAWPRFLAPLFARNGLAVFFAALISLVVFLAGFALANPEILFLVQTGPGAFYVLMAHNAMVVIFGIFFVAAVAALGAALANFWRDISEPAATLASPIFLAVAAYDAIRLRYLEGGGPGCMNRGERPTDHRAIFHHLTFWGFALCFAATCVGTIYHYGFGREAPYAWWDVPVVLGTLGGIGLVLGTPGLLIAKLGRDPPIADPQNFGMELAFIAMLFLTGLSGLVLLLYRATPAMGVLLASHLGFVFAVFITFAYGKFVHGLYRFAALVRYARERRGLARAAAAEP
ncbi:MAG: tricarballylate utilization 4Fe-4S protein TcuB [Acetobacteraceae bacterium]